MDMMIAEDPKKVAKQVEAKAESTGYNDDTRGCVDEARDDRSSCDRDGVPIRVDWHGDEWRENQTETSKPSKVKKIRRTRPLMIRNTNFTE